ncbi:MAG: membrane integrity-associated transporter subunit PqiC [Methyloversatilis sp.]|jgi:cholesterol transport system auxiliary component|nr:membrane integrity-associated transporter subunit PqiC [Methyloversatilis sp.]MBP6193039.1 membrane integrity-associated transporter subunit PqiC [Methyloversatilis sp.]MBP9116884.1 membrane integrity-associated transporter subunit PqiC [Methyloversatilis sp.]
MKYWLTCALLLTLAGCGSLVTRQPPPALHDLGSARERLDVSLSVRDIEVRAPSWLEGSAMHYRLVYESLTRRNVYAYSRWAAAPSEMLRVALRRMLETDVAGDGRACRLDIEIDEFIHDYERPDRARALLTGRALLMDSRGQRVLARLPFAISEAATNPDAAGGVAAMVRAVDVLGRHVAAWMDSAAVRGGHNGC